MRRSLAPERVVNFVGKIADCERWHRRMLALLAMLSRAIIGRETASALAGVKRGSAALGNAVAVTGSRRTWLIAFQMQNMLTPL
jgi:hypothetical protein